MKKLLLSFVLLISGVSTFAQSGGPDAFGYIWRGSGHPQGPTYNWVDITSFPGVVQVAGLTDDNTSAFIPIGFQFPYYWYTVSQFKVGSNGYIIFNNGAMASPFPAIPSATLPNDFIAPFMADLNFSGAGNTAACYYWSNLSDSLIVSYIDVPFWINSNPPYSGTNSFQIILSKVDSSITFQYLTQAGTSTGTGNFLSIGIENSTGSDGLQHSLNTYPNQSTAVKFYYPASITQTINDASVTYNNNPSTGGLFLSQNGAPFTMTSRIENTGNQSLSSFNVDMRVDDNTNLTQAQETLTSSALTPGQTEDLSAVTTFNPITAGTYYFHTSTQLAGDATPTNNTKTLELVVVDTTQPIIPLTYAGSIPEPLNAGISWTGGAAGVGVEFVPPFYPCYVASLDFFIVSNTAAAAFYSLVYDNTGPGNGPGNLLDSSYVDVPNVLAPNIWNTVTLQSPLTVDSGSLFVGWMMDGNSITIGTDTTGPISNRTYEILGAWSIFRYREDRDIMIRVNVSSDPTVGIHNQQAADLIGQFYPAPSHGIVFLNANLKNVSGESSFTFYDLQGQMVEKTRTVQAGTGQRLSFDISNLSAGTYVCKIVSGDHVYNRKLVVGQ